MKNCIVIIAFLTLAMSVWGQDGAQQKRINEAIEKGVAHLRETQKEDGTWPYPDLGATALTGLALLESGVPGNDPAIQKAARAVRAETPAMASTYSASLTIMFLDRLGDPLDIPIIEILSARLLLGGQNGGWGYTLPSFDVDEGFLANHVKLRAVGQAKPVKKAAKPSELPRHVQLLLARAKPDPADALGDNRDNSNTQFATLAIWIARRYGLPVDGTLALVDRRHRRLQHSNGGWSYQAGDVPPGEPGYEPKPALTCGALVGLAAFHATRKDAAKKVILDDPVVKKALRNLEGYVGKTDQGQPLPQGGNGYYFLWSLERMAMLYGVKKIGDHDWYLWGAELLLACQPANGGWVGDYHSCVDTSFALLFLRRSNIAPDLTNILMQGITKDSSSPSTPKQGTVDTPSSSPATTPDLSIAQTRAEAVRLSTALLDAAAGELDAILEKFRAAKGAPFNQTLAATIPQLKGDSQSKARKTLAERVANLTPGDIRKEMKVIDAEIRRAAAGACAVLKAKALVPDLIDMLADAEAGVVQAAHQSLREITSQDFGPATGASREDRDKAVRAWREWWKKQ